MADSIFKQMGSIVKTALDNQETALTALINEKADKVEVYTNIEIDEQIKNAKPTQAFLMAYTNY